MSSAGAYTRKGGRGSDVNRKRPLPVCTEGYSRASRVSCVRMHTGTVHVTADHVQKP